MAFEQNFRPQAGSLVCATDMTFPTSICDFQRPSLTSCHTSLAIPSRPVAVSPMLLTKTDTSSSSDSEEYDRRTSLNGLITVIKYFPREGEPMTPLTIELLKSPKLTEGTSLKLLVGSAPVATTHVRGSRPIRLIASMPDLHLSTTGASPGMPLRLEVVDRFTKITLDSCLFGWFTYWVPLTRPKSESPTFSSLSLKRPFEMDTVNQQDQPTWNRPCSGRRMTLPMISPPRILLEGKLLVQAYDQRDSPPTSPSDSSDDVPLRSNFGLPGSLRSEFLAEAAPWTLQFEPIPHPQVSLGIISKKCELVLEDDLGRMTKGWSRAEATAGRRVVRFFIERDEHRLRLSFEALQPKEYQDGMICVSCIYYNKTDQCYITSTELLDLLQGILSVKFSVEHKNRYRRNLEELKPLPIRKSERATSEFYNRLMRYDEPKPRRINKDLKMFSWSLLEKALIKIVTKYTVSELGPLHPPKSLVKEEESTKPKRAKLSPAPKYDIVLEGVKAESVSPLLNSIPLDSPADEIMDSFSPKPIKQAEDFPWENTSFELDYPPQGPLASNSGAYVEPTNLFIPQPATLTPEIQTQALNLINAEFDSQDARGVLAQFQATIKEEEDLLYCTHPVPGSSLEDQTSIDDNQVFGQFLLPTAFLDIESENTDIFTASRQ